MARHLLLNDVRTTTAKFNTGDILDDSQFNLTELTNAGGITTPYLVSYEPLRLRFISLRSSEDRTPASVLFQSLSIAGLLPGGGGGGLTYTVGPVGSGANFTSVQDAIDDAELNLTPVSILVMADTYTENLTITKPGINITGFNDRAAGQFHLVGNITYNLDANGEIALQQVDVDGQIIIAGTFVTQLYLIAVEAHASTADGVIDHVNSNTSSTIIVEGNVRVTNNGSGPAFRATNGGRFDGENCRLAASSVANSAVVTNGVFIARNIETTGAIIYTGTTPFGLSMSGAATNLTATAAVIDLTGTSQPSIITGARMTSLTNVAVFAGATPAKLTFANIQTFVGFGTFDTSQGTRLASDGIVFKSSTAGAGPNFLNENGAYTNPGLSYPAIDSFDTQRWFYLASSISGGTVANEGTESGFDLKTSNQSAYDDPSPPDVFALPVNETLSAAATIFMRFESPDGTPDPDISNGFTVSGWVKLQGQTSNSDFIISKFGNTVFTGTDPIVMTGNSNDTINAIINFGSGSSTTVTSDAQDTALQDHAWCHIGMTINAANDTLNLYVNGRLHDTSALAFAPIWGASGPWILSGHTTSTADGFNGQMFDFRVAEIERDEAWFRTMWTARRLLNAGT